MKNVNIGFLFTWDTFFGGMSTTQRSESINSFFDKYVSKKTTLKEFVEKYKVVLQDREEAEKQADFNTCHKQPVLKTPSPFEKKLSMVYTQEVFKKFQVEVMGLDVILWKGMKIVISLLLQYSTLRRMKS